MHAQQVVETLAGIVQVQLGELEVALEIAKASEGTEAKWKQLGELAMSSGRLDVRPCS